MGPLMTSRMTWRSIWGSHGEKVHLHDDIELHALVVFDVLGLRADHVLNDVAAHRAARLPLVTMVIFCAVNHLRIYRQKVRV